MSHTLMEKVLWPRPGQLDAKQLIICFQRCPQSPALNIAVGTKLSTHKFSRDILHPNRDSFSTLACVLTSTLSNKHELAHLTFRLHTT